jgi:4Fe-4S ferredoxin
MRLVLLHNRLGFPMPDKTSSDQGGLPATKEASGKFRPVINRNKCEGRADCVDVCPYQVFAIGVLPATERSTLSIRGKIKGAFHGWMQAFTVNEQACHACGLCVASCPEQAITLQRIASL